MDGKGESIWGREGVEGGERIGKGEEGLDLDICPPCRGPRLPIVTPMETGRDLEFYDGTA